MKRHSSHASCFSVLVLMSLSLSLRLTHYPTRYSDYPLAEGCHETALNPIFCFWLLQPYVGCDHGLYVVHQRYSHPYACSTATTIVRVTVSTNGATRYWTKIAVLIAAFARWPHDNSTSNTTVLAVGVDATETAAR